MRGRCARGQTASTGKIAPAKNKTGKGQKAKRKLFSKQKILEESEANCRLQNGGWSSRIFCFGAIGKKAGSKNRGVRCVCRQKDCFRCRSHFKKRRAHYKVIGMAVESFRAQCSFTGYRSRIRIGMRGQQVVPIRFRGDAKDEKQHQQ